MSMNDKIKKKWELALDKQGKLKPKYKDMPRFKVLKQTDRKALELYQETIRNMFKEIIEFLKK